MRRITTVAAILFVGVMLAAPVSAQDASHCISIEGGEVEGSGWADYELYNRCDYRVVIFYCKTRAGSDSCGSGPSEENQYYTHSRIIRSGDSSELSINADKQQRLHWAPCKSCYDGWSSKGFVSNSNGDYACKQCP